MLRRYLQNDFGVCFILNFFNLILQIFKNNPSNITICECLETTYPNVPKSGGNIFVILLLFVLSQAKAKSTPSHWLKS